MQPIRNKRFQVLSMFYTLMVRLLKPATRHNSVCVECSYATKTKTMGKSSGSLCSSCGSREMEFGCNFQPNGSVFRVLARERWSALGTLCNLYAFLCPGTLRLAKNQAKTPRNNRYAGLLLHFQTGSERVADTPQKISTLVIARASN